ncbi:MAG: hypothetical protein ABTQ32_28030 [Myxococcaceae bacterium]
MREWSSMERLDRLSRFYELDAIMPWANDATFLAAIRQTFWSTSAGDFVGCAFAIIAPGCELRPHLVPKLLRAPIRAAVAVGVEDAARIIAWGVACADQTNPLVVLRPTLRGERWLRDRLPALTAVVRQVVQETLHWVAADFPGDDLW